jgi:hypothetical protein
MILSVDKCYALSSVNLMNEHNTTCQNVTLNDSLIKRFGENCTSNQCNALCDVCMFVANITQDLILVENITLNITSEFIEELCFLIGGEIIYEECKVAFTLMQDILNCLTDGFSPSETCQLLNLCPKNDHAITHTVSHDDDDYIQTPSIELS